MTKDTLKSLPPRVAARPNLESWSMTELLSLREAAALHWPDGRPISTKGLRNARSSGKLATVTIADKIFTCRRAINDMSKCTNAPTEPPRATTCPPTFDDMVQARLGQLLTPKK